MEVKIIDNFLDRIDFKKVCEFANNKEWTIQQSDHNTKGNAHFLMYMVSNNEFFSTYLFNLIEKQLDSDYELQRVYYNGQWSGREGDFHDDGCDITALLYVSEYQYGWGGFTEIMTSPTEPTLIHPLQNRLCIFPGRIKHKGYSFCYQSCPMRVSLAFKLNTK